MLTSKQLLKATNISRATLHNYIGMGLLPKPVIGKPGPGEGRARQIGNFPDECLAIVQLIQTLKKEGLSMSEIVNRIKTDKPEPDQVSSSSRMIEGNLEVETPETNGKSSKTVKKRELTLSDLNLPICMVNYNFEVEWSNPEFNKEILGNEGQMSPELEARDLFQLLLNSPNWESSPDWGELLIFHLKLAKNRFSKSSLDRLFSKAELSKIRILKGLYEQADVIELDPIIQGSFLLKLSDDGEKSYRVFASTYREQIIFIYTPESADQDSLLDFLAERDQVIRDLIRKRPPVITSVCVLVADLQDSVKISAELPPNEYFDLINDLWNSVQPVFKKYYGTHGRHAGDGMVYYFFPQPDTNYILNALICSQEIKNKIREVSKDWQLRKNWPTELYFNIGINEGREWLGTYVTPTQVEFTVLGDTINYAGRLSDFARFGSIWATKNLLSALNNEECSNIMFGIHRENNEGRKILVPTSYSRISNLVDLRSEKYEKFNDIANLAVTEIIEIFTPETE